VLRTLADRPEYYRTVRLPAIACPAFLPACLSLSSGRLMTC
jgi:hypothetical protein